MCPSIRRAARSGCPRCDRPLGSLRAGWGPTIGQPADRPTPPRAVQPHQEGHGGGHPPPLVSTFAHIHRHCHPGRRRWQAVRRNQRSHPRPGRCRRPPPRYGVRLLGRAGLRGRSRRGRRRAGRSQRPRGPIVRRRGRGPSAVRHHAPAWDGRSGPMRESSVDRHLRASSGRRHGGMRGSLRHYAGQRPGTSCRPARGAEWQRID
mmetsp:Transcript_30944/g.90484  ORF Transcript_30944/g.90484 Transcript_30944/m.90484 type:complete len:205 (-) Transcript_30944:615-1229(-)